METVLGYGETEGKDRDGTEMGWTVQRWDGRYRDGMDGTEMGWTVQRWDGRYRDGMDGTEMRGTVQR